eukprot:s245_g16.t1
MSRSGIQPRGSPRLFGQFLPKGIGQPRTSEATCTTYVEKTLEKNGECLGLSSCLVSCLHFVAGTTCLNNAVTVREDLVNAKGESYPVGVAYGSWTSTKVLAEIVRIVIEEILGYNAQRILEV